MLQSHALTHPHHHHRHTHNGQYNERYSEADVLQAWTNVMTAYGKKWNVFALDVKNEPNGVATWVRARVLDYYKPLGACV